MMGSKVYLVGAVRGLVSEGDRVEAIVKSLGVDVVALSVSREGLEAMKGHSAKNPEPKPTNIEERIYIKGLSRFGKVMKPPPCFSMAQASAVGTGIPVIPLDMGDEHYSAAYCKYVSTLDLMRQGRNGKHFLRHEFKARTPEDFVMEWDRLVNRLKGYRMLEMSRERWFAKGIMRLSEKYSRPMAVIEMERMPGVMRHLMEMDCKFETIH